MHAIIRTLIALATVVVLTSACGVKSAYNNADWLLVRWVNDRVSLTSEQELTLRDELEGHLQWHCASELDAYSRFLRAIDQDIAADRVTMDTLAVYRDRAAGFGERILDRVRPTLIELLASLSDDQIDELMASFEERNLELAEEMERSEDERRRARIEALTKGMQRFSGRPSGEQRKRMEAWAASLAPTAELALEERLAQQAKLREALAIRGNRAAFERAMASLLEPGSSRSHEYRQRRDNNLEKTQRAILDLHRMASSQQRERLRDRLGDWAQKFDDLSCS